MGQDEALYSFWENSRGRKIFSEKFQLNLGYIRFGDKASQIQRKGTDKFAAIRELLENVMFNCQKAFFLHPNVTIDEQLFPCRSRYVLLYNACLNSL